MTRRGAARRAGDAAGRRPRDDGDRARLGVRAAAAQPGRARARCTRRSRTATTPTSTPWSRRRCGAARRPGRRPRRARGALRARRLRDPARASRSTLRSPRSTAAPDRYPDPARVPPRALPRRRRARHLHVAAVRRRHAALPGRELRHLRDAGRDPPVLERAQLAGRRPAPRERRAQGRHDRAAARSAGGAERASADDDRGAAPSAIASRGLIRPVPRPSRW